VVGSRCRRRPTARKPTEQAYVTALVGEIGVDTATIARRSATIPTRIRLAHRGRKGVHTGEHPRRPPAAAKACVTACNCRSTWSIALTSWSDRLRSRAESRPRAENEAAFCTDRPAGDAGQLGNRSRLSEPDNGITFAFRSSPRYTAPARGGFRATRGWRDRCSRSAPFPRQPSAPRPPAQSRQSPLMLPIRTLRD